MTRILRPTAASEVAGAYRTGMDEEHSVERAFGEAVGRLGPALLVGVDGLEKAFRRLHPPAFESLRAALVEPYANLEAARASFADVALPDPSLSEFRSDLLGAAEWTARALGTFLDREMSRMSFLLS